MSQKLPVRPHHNDNIEPCVTGCRDRGNASGLKSNCQIESPQTLPAVVLMGENGGNSDGGDDAELTVEAEQEVERVSSLPTYQPTKSDYDDHCVTHSPYRPCYRHCVEGRGQEF